MPFHGPAQLVRAWARFVDEYTQGGQSTFRAQYAALLDDIAFGNGPAAVVARSNDNAETCRRIQYGVEDVARALSAQTQRVSMRPLHRAVEAGVIARWIEVKRQWHLDPSQPIAARAGLSQAVRGATRTRRSELLHSPEGALLAGLLRMAEDQIIRVEARRVHRRWASQVTYDEVLSLAHDVFDDALFHYSAERGTTFSTYVQGGLRLSLPRKVRHALKHTRGATSFGPVRGNQPDAEPMEASLPDTRETTPSSRLLREEAGSYLRRIVDELEPRQREVLRLRFGLTDGVRHTLEEVAQRLEFSKQWVNVIEHEALAELRVRLKIRGLDGVWFEDSDGVPSRGR